METKEKKLIDGYIRRNKKIPKKKSNFKWILEITIMAFVISFLFSSASEAILPNVTMMIGIVVVILFILIGVLFDMIGIAVTSADESPFHSMNSKKIKGSSISIRILKNRAQVSSFCNDVIGDICGIISGSAGVTIAIKFAHDYNTNLFFTTLIVTSIIASLTIGGKALGKTFAVNNNSSIVFKFSRIISYVYYK